MKKILLGLLALIVVLAVVGFFLPTRYTIDRSLAMKATPAQIHVWAGDLARWDEWTPWAMEDPSIVTTRGDRTTGVGASQTWTSDDGDGELTLTASDPETGLAYDMAFLMGETRAPAKSAMRYSRDGDATVVTWTMEGDVADFMPPVAAGYMKILMAREIAGMFDRGLANLKEKVEQGG